VKRPGSSGYGTTVRDTARYDGISFDELPLNVIECAQSVMAGTTSLDRDLNQPRVIASRGQGFKSLQLLRKRRICWHRSARQPVRVSRVTKPGLSVAGYPPAPLALSRVQGVQTTSGLGEPLPGKSAQTVRCAGLTPCLAYPSGISYGR
jgi:hypothetical protein